MTDYTQVPRAFEIAPTDEKLKQDCINVVKHIEMCWDGEVETVIIMSRRDGTMNLAWAGSFNEREKQVRLLKELLAREPVSVKGKG